MIVFDDMVYAMYKENSKDNKILKFYRFDLKTLTNIIREKKNYLKLLSEQENVDGSNIKKGIEKKLNHPIDENED
jgi:hypothetical protein